MKSFIRCLSLEFSVHSMSCQISHCGDFVSLNWRGGINVDSRQAYEAIKTRLMPDWRCVRDCICMLRRRGWPISTLSHSPSHMNTKPYNFLWPTQRRRSPVAFAVKRQHSQTQAKMQTLWKLYQAKKCLTFILRRVHSVAAASLMFSSGLPSCGFTLGFSENLAPGEIQGEKLGEFTRLFSRRVTAKKCTVSARAQ